MSRSTAPIRCNFCRASSRSCERALEQAGLKTADNGLQFTLRDQSFTGQNGGGNGAQPRAAQLVIPDPDLPADRYHADLLPLGSRRRSRYPRVNAMV